MATYSEGTLLKASGPEVGKMEGGQLRSIPDPATLARQKLHGAALQTIADSDWDQIPKGAPYPSRADGTLLQGSGPNVYVMLGAQRRWIPDPETFTARGYSWGAIQHISDADLTAIAEGPPLASVHQTTTVNPMLVQLQQLQQGLEQQLTQVHQQLGAMMAPIYASKQTKAIMEFDNTVHDYDKTRTALSNQLEETITNMKIIFQNIG
jgi:hypothetical protein